MIVMIALSFSHSSPQTQHSPPRPRTWKFAGKQKGFTPLPNLQLSSKSLPPFFEPSLLGIYYILYGIWYMVDDKPVNHVDEHNRSTQSIAEVAESLLWLET